LYNNDRLAQQKRSPNLAYMAGQTCPERHSFDPTYMTRLDQP